MDSVVTFHTGCFCLDCGSKDVYLRIREEETFYLSDDGRIQGQKTDMYIPIERHIVCRKCGHEFEPLGSPFGPLEATDDRKKYYSNINKQHTIEKNVQSNPFCAQV